MKKRISLSVLLRLYKDIQKIAYVQRRSTSELVALIMEEYRRNHGAELEEYEKIVKRKRRRMSTRRRFHLHWCSNIYNTIK